MLVQSGRNPKWPAKVSRYWKYGSGPVPDWLSDASKVIGIDESGQPVLSVLRLSGDSIQIQGPTGPLVTLKTSDSWVIYDDSLGFLSMTEKQKELLYEEA